MRLWLDVLNGFPSIIIGVFVFQFAVKSATPILGLGHHQRAWAGGFALAIIMIPLVSRTTMEVLALIPDHLREASYALGVSKWRTVVSVVVPSALGGIVTAPRSPSRRRRRDGPALHLLIFGQIELGPSNSVALGAGDHLRVLRSPDYNLNEQAWAAAFVLIGFVLVTASARLCRWQRRKLGQAGAAGAFPASAPSRHSPSLLHPARGRCTLAEVKPRQKEWDS